MTKLIYIGREFYEASKTTMSCLYMDDGSRYDWGFVERDLRNGKEVSIRPASLVEMAHFNRKLKEIQAEFEKNPA